MQQSIEGKTDKEIVAEFMDLDIDGNNVTDGVQETTIDQLKYDTSWDWLMPVVEKIEKLGNHVVIFCLQKEAVCAITDTYPVNVKSNSKIDAVYKAVVEFIKWYNSLAVEKKQNPIKRYGMDFSKR